MPPGPTLEEVSRLGTSESDRAAVTLINAEPGRSRREALTHLLKDGIARVPGYSYPRETSHQGVPV